MAKNTDQQQTNQALQVFVQWFAGLSWQLKLGVLGVVAVALLVLYATGTPSQPGPPDNPRPENPGPGLPTSVPTGPPSAELLQRQSFVFCWWNLENFFDNKVDGWKTKPDEEYDEWFGSNPDMVALKVKNLTSALLKLNGGIGPDIIAVAEAEDSRTADTPGALVLLRDGLNAGISDAGLRYRNILWQHMHGGRAIITAIVTRLPVDESRTRLVHGSERILQGVIRVRDRDLYVIASHWTSRLTDKTGDRRAKYGTEIYNYFRTLFKNDPEVPLVIAGDFNDGPEEPSVVKHLWATGEKDKVFPVGADPYLFNLMLNPKFGAQGTIASGSRMDTFDQIVVSPAMLNPDSKSWTVDTDSITIVTEGTSLKKHGLLFPRRFDSPRFEGVRGCSDHLPVSVTLRLPKG
jgi:endonuclease/exonuclease/phosphatase family metal-dependent hydrolase